MRKLPRSITFVGFLLAGAAVAWPASVDSPAAAAEDEAALVVVVDAVYSYSHGWGHVFKCTVREVLVGELAEDVIYVSNYGTVDLYGGLLAPFENYERLIMSFMRAPEVECGPPPGFRDASGIYWQTIFVWEWPAED